MWFACWNAFLYQLLYLFAINQFLPFVASILQIYKCVEEVFLFLLKTLSAYWLTHSCNNFAVTVSLSKQVLVHRVWCPSMFVARSCHATTMTLQRYVGCTGYLRSSSALLVTSLYNFFFSNPIAFWSIFVWKHTTFSIAANTFLFLVLTTGHPSFMQLQFPTVLATFLIDFFVRFD